MRYDIMFRDEGAIFMTINYLGLINLGRLDCKARKHTPPELYDINAL